jgi:hypothetical protein
MSTPDTEPKQDPKNEGSEGEGDTTEVNVNVNPKPKEDK